MIILVIILLLIFALGGGYYSRPYYGWYGPGIGGIVGVILLALLIYVIIGHF